MHSWLKQKGGELKTFAGMLFLYHGSPSKMFLAVPLKVVSKCVTYFEQNKINECHTIQILIKNFMAPYSDVKMRYVQANVVPDTHKSTIITPAAHQGLVIMPI